MGTTPRCIQARGWWLLMQWCPSTPFTISINLRTWESQQLTSSPQQLQAPWPPSQPLSPSHLLQWLLLIPTQVCTSTWNVTESGNFNTITWTLWGCPISQLDMISIVFDCDLDTFVIRCYHSLKPSEVLTRLGSSSRGVTQMCLAKQLGQTQLELFDFPIINDLLSRVHLDKSE